MNWYKVLLGIAALLCIAGAIMQINHMFPGRELVLGGMVLGILTLVAENRFLKQKQKDK